ALSGAATGFILHSVVRSKRRSSTERQVTPLQLLAKIIGSSASSTLPNGSCSRRARRSREVSRPSSDRMRQHLRADMLESLAAELGRYTAHTLLHPPRRLHGPSTPDSH